MVLSRQIGATAEANKTPDGQKYADLAALVFPAAAAAALLALLGGAASPVVVIALGLVPVAMWMLHRRVGSRSPIFSTLGALLLFAMAFMIEAGVGMALILGVPGLGVLAYAALMILVIMLVARSGSPSHRAPGGKPPARRINDDDDWFAEDPPKSPPENDDPRR